jgi:hypothetical protein
MADTAGWLRPGGVALCGALIGLSCAWTARARPPEALHLADGSHVVHPMYVEPTPWWLYAVCAGLGAALALVAARTVVRLVQR